MRSGFSANAGPLSRVTLIICPSLDLLDRLVPVLIGTPRGPVKSSKSSTGLTRRAITARRRLLLEVDQVLQDLVRGRDDPGVGLETPLGDDEVRELGRQVDVRHLERAARDRAPSALPGHADLRRARVDRLAVQRRALLLQTVGVRERGDRDLAEGLTATVRERTGDEPLFGDAEPDDRADAGAVLRERGRGVQPARATQAVGVGRRAEVERHAARGPRAARAGDAVELALGHVDAPA